MLKGHSVLAILALLLMLPIALAQETPKGLRPGHPLYFFDVFLDNLRLSIAPGSARARIGLLIAQERLAELAEKAAPRAADGLAKALAAVDDADAHALMSAEEHAAFLQERKEKIDARRAALPAVAKERVDAAIVLRRK